MNGFGGYRKRNNMNPILFWCMKPENDDSNTFHIYAVDSCQLCILWKKQNPKRSRCLTDNPAVLVSF